MAVSIRLRREGAKNRPYYKVVVADSRSPRDGKFIEIIGTYDPKKPGHNSTLKLDRIDHWIAQGAQPSDTVRSLIKKNKKHRRAPPSRRDRAAPAPAARNPPRQLLPRRNRVVVEPAAPTTMAEESAIAAESPATPAAQPE